MKHIKLFESFNSTNESIDKSSTNEINEDAMNDKIVALYKQGLSQVEIADELKVNIDKVVNATKNLGYDAIKDGDKDDRKGDDPMSKQYYGRVLKNK